MRTIGIKLADGSFYPVMEEGTAQKKTLELTTAHNNQTCVMVDLYRSKTCSMDDAEYIDTLKIENLNEHPNGEPSIAFDVDLNEDGELSYSIADPETGTSSNSEITLVSRTVEERLQADDYSIEDTTEDSSEEDSGKGAAVAAGVVAGAGLMAAAAAIAANNKDDDFEAVDEVPQESADNFTEDDFTLGDPTAQEDLTAQDDFTAQEDLTTPDDATTPDNTAAVDDATQTDDFSIPDGLTANPDISDESDFADTVAKDPLFADDTLTSDDTFAVEEPAVADDTFAGDEPAVADETFTPEEPAADDDTFASEDTPSADDTITGDEPTAMDDTFAADDTLSSDDTFATDDTFAADTIPDFEETTIEEPVTQDSTIEDDFSTDDMDFGEPENSLENDDFSTDDMDFDSNPSASSTAGMDFSGLYDKETEMGNAAENQDDDIKKKTRTPVIICIICAIICLIATALVLLVLPTKFNLRLRHSQKKQETAVEKTVEPPKEESKTQQKAAEPEPVPQAKEDEVVIIEKAEEVKPLPPPAPETKPAGVTYKIRWGDTLWDIADTYYKNPWRYKKIAKFNNIKNPDYIISGTVITIPAE